MKVASINVNGIRAAARKGMFEWLEKLDADVICLQELKAQPDQIEGEPFHPKGYHTFFHSAEKKGYSGVGIYCKQEPDRVQVGLGKGFEDVDSEGRYLQADFGNLSVASLYMPSGSSKEERQAFKINMMTRFETTLTELADSGRQGIICGDWNICHKKRDIKNWRGNQKNSGFLPESANGWIGYSATLSRKPKVAVEVLQNWWMPFASATMKVSNTLGGLTAARRGRITPVGELTIR